VSVSGLGYGGPDLSLAAVIYNPNSFGATMIGANYSVYADGNYLGNGQTTHEYVLSPQSTETFVLPVSIGWKSALQTMGNYLIDHGGVTWEVKGTADIEVGGVSLSIPFELVTS
jgi:LEA14-like dessication related protein